MKYIIKNSDIMLNGKIVPEGSVVELSELQTKGIENFLIPLNSEGHSEPVEESQKKTKIKSSVALAKEGKGYKK